MALLAQARDGLGQQGTLQTTLPVAPREAVLVRPAHSLVGPGGAVEATLLAAPARQPVSGDRVYLDVVKDGQTLATRAATLRRGRARVRFGTGGNLFGLLELRAYRLARSGERVGTSRMVYVDQPGRLKITARADRAVYRPGQRARIAFSVVDSRTGDGVQAALGLLAVDEAVMSLGGLKSDSPRIFFTLASQMRGAIEDLKARPGGRGLESWIAGTGGNGDGGAAAQRARAADVLLGAVSPPDGEVWETNPWKVRREAWADQAPLLIEAAREYVATHSAGRLTAGGWRFHPELVPRMARHKAIPAELVRDPWRRTVRPWYLRRVDHSFSFSAIAAEVAPQKLVRIYDALREVWRELSLRREPVKGLARIQWPLVLPHDLPTRLVRAGKLKPHEVRDPWGRPFRVRRRTKIFVNPYHTGLVSRYIVYSAGPDRQAGTRDDITPPGPRVLSAVFARDTALGRDAADALGRLVGDEIGEAYGVGGMGLMGTARGGGGYGAGTIGLGTLGTIGKGGGGPGMQARVRSRFPETLLWNPELITDRAGRATLDLELADSITTWRLAATGSTSSGLLGSTRIDLRVFQDFFVDLDLPGAMTQGDRLSVPVTVYNYLKRGQTVTLKLKREPWFSPAGPLKQTVTLGPSGIGVRHFPIVARKVGRGELTVQARASGGLADAVRRATQVEPDGVEHAISRSGPLRAAVAHELEIPAAAIAGTPRVQLAIHPGPLSQIQEGLDGMLRMPGGCFEQTSSSTYPNLLVLDYLRRTGKSTPAVENKARAYINAGYQRLISFEVKGGGFSWFGDAPANRILTAYGLMEFFDMARVHPVGPALIRRTQRWLVAQQRPDGSWAPDKRMILDGAANAYTRDGLRITAYIANALRRTGYRGKALNRALAWVRRHAGQARDAYTLAVLGNLLAPDSDATARRVRARLWALRRGGQHGLLFDGPRASLTHGAGLSGRLESTALAALAFLGSDAPPAGTGRLLDTLVASKDSFGSWHSTQATILSLQALLLQHRRSRSRAHGTVQVLVDGRPRGRVTLREGQDEAHRLDLTPWARAGRHRVSLRFSGEGNLQYQLVGRYWLRRGRRAAKSRGTLVIATRFDRHKLRRGQPLRLGVEVRNLSPRGVDMPLVSLALPPGFAVEERALTALVGRGTVSKVQRVGNRALLYLTRLEPGQFLRFGVRLRGRYPLRVQARPSVVYEYYRPENRGESQPRVLQVM
jgi:hypothetical protein